MEYTVGAELEFYLLDPDGNSIADLSSGKFPQKRFSVSKQYEQNFNLFMKHLEGYNITPESGPGQYEVQFAPVDKASELGMRVNEFKEFAHLAAGKSGILISFDAKPLAGYCGSSLHVHFSSPLFDPWGLIANKGIVKMKRDADNEYVLWAIGGMLDSMPQDIRLFIPTAESRLRIEPWLNAPTKICWGRNNRSTAIRIPDGKPKRVEHRVSGADADAEKVIIAIVNAAEKGIKNKINPGEPIFGNAWDDKYALPSILTPQLA